MNNSDANRAAEGMGTGRAWKRKLSDGELRRINGGQGEPGIKSTEDLKNDPSVQLFGGTCNFLCKTCGMITMHMPVSGGGFACVFCGTLRKDT